MCTDFSTDDHDNDDDDDDDDNNSVALHEMRFTLQSRYILVSIRFAEARNHHKASKTQDESSFSLSKHNAAKHSQAAASGRTSS